MPDHPPQNPDWMSLRMSCSAAAAAQLRGKTEAPPARGTLPPSQRATLWRSTARSRRRSLVHTDAEVPCGSVYSTDNSVLRRAG